VPLSELTILGRIGLAFILGFLLGLERESKGHQAGLRTHILVCLGACLFTLAGTFGLPLEGILPFAPAIRTDVSRVASQVVIGIGYLGGGSILRSGDTVHGLTTAANLWIAAAIGLCCALGFYVGALAGTGLSLVCLLLLKPVERWIARVGRSLRRGEPPDADI
jgi:putative Mg2+ transporter-C (MgtC) family protein